MEVQPIRLMIVDDQAMVRRGMKAFLDEYEGISVIGEAADGLKGIQLMEQLKPDIVLIDLSMPGIDGIETIKRMIAIQPEQRIIVLTVFDNEDRLSQAVEAGAMGFLSKNAEPSELIQSIYKVYSGMPAINNMILWRLLRQKAGVQPDERIDSLSEREIQVLRLMANGCTDDEIAEQLCVTNITIRTHISRALSKLGLQNRVQAALYSHRSGLVTLEAESS